MQSNTYTCMQAQTATLDTSKREEKRLSVNEMRVLRWMCGVTQKDKIRNKYIRGAVGVVNISRKVTERRKWLGHVKR